MSLPLLPATRRKHRAEHVGVFAIVEAVGKFVQVQGLEWPMEFRVREFPA